jgi:biopolymer transport protein ExbB/TolQ
VEGVSLFRGPELARVFVMFLAVMGVITAARSVRLCWRLFWPLASGRVSLDLLRQGAVSADRLAKAALGRTLTLERPSETHRDASAEPSPGNREAALRTLRTADIRFRYVWRLSQASVIATRGLMPVTLLGTLFGTVVNIYPAFNWEVAGPTVTGAAAAYTVGNVTLNRLAAGLLLCAAIWAVSTFFQAWLYRRMASWRYFLATTRDIL